MGHQDYRHAGFRAPVHQHNIMAFVGNGFDIQVLRDYGSPVDTRYESFFHFLKLRSFNNQNAILQEMDALRGKKDNWSDVEGVVGALLDSQPFRAAELVGALREMQGQFSEFLNLAVPSSLLDRLGSDSMDSGLAVASLAKFLGDLDADEYANLEFPGRVDHRNILKFLFINFNYTSLLDDYVYLDQNQFDPRPYKTVDRNFTFEVNPSGVPGCAQRPGDTYSCYLVTDTVHPHGHQSIPRSLLFGIDTPSQTYGNQDPALRLAKPFWAQNDVRYEHLFDDTELFMVFGCSLGASDRWWWSRIASALGSERVRPHREHVVRCVACESLTACATGEATPLCQDCGTELECGLRATYVPELILYWWHKDGSQLDKESIRRRFFAAANVQPTEEMSRRVHIVPFTASAKRVWLNTTVSATADEGPSN